MTKLKLIEDITVEDLAAHRWCYYQNEDEGYDAFEHVISDKHPDFSDDIIELELAEFHFSNGKVAYGLYDGSEAFNIVTPQDWYSFWYGDVKPDAEDVERLSRFLAQEGLELPVTARSKWSGVEKHYRGIQYLNSNNEICEIVI